MRKKENGVLEFLQRLEQKIERNEERLLNETDSTRREILKDIIERDTVTLRGYVQQLAPPCSKYFLFLVPKNLIL